MMVRFAREDLYGFEFTLDPEHVLRSLQINSESDEIPPRKPPPEWMAQIPSGANGTSKVTRTLSLSAVTVEPSKSSYGGISVSVGAPSGWNTTRTVPRNSVLDLSRAVTKVLPRSSVHSGLLV